jgi:hypothetical protein
MLDAGQATLWTVLTVTEAESVAATMPVPVPVSVSDDNVRDSSPSSP